MTKSKDINDPKSITAYIQKLDPEFAEMLKAIRQVILSTDKTIGEQIKWNSPSFFFTGQMKPFDPKEYKRDIVVVNTRNGVALLVFPTGGTIIDTTGILEGDYKDGRRMVTFKTLAEVKKKKKDLQNVIQAWLKLVDRD